MKKYISTFILIFTIILNSNAQEALVTKSALYYAGVKITIGLDRNGKWGFFEGERTNSYNPYRGNTSMYFPTNGDIVEGENGETYTIYSDGTYKKGNKSDILTKTNLLPNMWGYVSRYGAKLHNYRIILNKNKTWGVKGKYRLGSSLANIDWIPGNKLIRADNSKEVWVDVRAFNNNIYTLFADGTYKLSDKKELSYNHFEKLSGRFEGVSTLYKRDKTGRYNKGKKLVKISLYAFEDINKNVKIPNLFLKVDIYKGKKGKKIEESFYIFKSYKDRELNRKQKLSKNKNNYTIEAYGNYLFDLNIEVTNNQLTIKDDKNQLTGNYLRIGNLEDSSELIKKGNLIMIDYFFKKYRYMHKTLNLNSYKVPRYNFGKRNKYNFNFDITLLDKNFFEIYQKDTLKLKLSSTNKFDEEKLIPEVIYRTFSLNKFLFYLPNTKYIFIQRASGKPEYIMTLRDRRNPYSHTLDFTKATKIKRREQLEAKADYDRKKYAEEVNSWFKLTDEFYKIREVEKSLSNEEKVNFKKFGVENYMFFENIYHGLFNSVGGFDPVDIKKAYVQYFVNSGRLVHLLEKPVGFTFTVNTVQKSFIKTNTIESNTYNLIIDEKYANNVDLFKETATTTNGFRILFDLYKETQGAKSLFDDINTISRLLPKHSKAHKRFQENFHRFIEFSYLKKNVKPFLTSEKVSLNFPNVNENIKLQESKLVSDNGEDVQLFINAFNGKSSAFNNDKYNEFIDDYKSQIIRCTYYSKEYEIYYTLYFWKDKKPKIDLSKYNTHFWTDKSIAPLEYISESAINMNIGKPVKTAPKNLKEAIMKFYGN